MSSIVILTGAGISKEKRSRHFPRRGRHLAPGPAGGCRDAGRVPARSGPGPGLLQYASARPAAGRHCGPTTRILPWPGSNGNGPGDFLLATQNVDNLHERAGSKRLIHMHGEMLKARCTACHHVVPVGKRSDAGIDMLRLRPVRHDATACRLVRRDALRNGPDLPGVGRMRPVPVDRHFGHGLSGGGLSSARARAHGAHTVELNLGTVPKAIAASTRRSTARPESSCRISSSGCWRKHASVSALLRFSATYVLFLFSVIDLWISDHEAKRPD